MQLLASNTDFYLALQVSTQSLVELAHNIRKTELLNPLATLLYVG